MIKIDIAGISVFRIIAEDITTLWLSQKTLAIDRFSNYLSWFRTIVWYKNQNLDGSREFHLHLN